MKRLTLDGWTGKLEKTVGKIRGRLKGSRVTETEIQKIVDEVRQKRNKKIQVRPSIKSSIFDL